MSSLLADSAAPGPTPPLTAQWKKIDALLAKDQTATAAPLIERIYQRARRENDAPNQVRALLYKLRTMAAKERNAGEKGIAQLEADVKTAKFPARPILHSLLALLYAQYYESHLDELDDRTSGAEPTTDQVTSGQADGGTALATWDATRLGRAILYHFRASLDDEPQRQLATPLASLGDLATPSNANGRALRPSLYDLLAQTAFTVLEDQELTDIEPEEVADEADYPLTALYGPAREFAALPLKIPASDSLNHEWQALRVLQQLTALRLTQPADPAPLAAVDLQRFAFVQQLEEDSPLTTAAEKAALGQMRETYRALPISTLFTYRLANIYYDAGDVAAALHLIDEAVAQFPQSEGAEEARRLRATIEQASVSFSTTEEVLPGQPWRLSLTTRNVDRVYARAYRLASGETYDGTYHDERELPACYTRALRAAPVATWEIPVPTHQPYRSLEFDVAGPALAVGHYLLVMNTQPGEPARGTRRTDVAMGETQATGLTVLTRRTPDTNQVSLLVLDSQSGQLLPGVRAQVIYRQYREKDRPGTVQATDAQGTVALPNENDSNYLDCLKVWRGTDTLQMTAPSGYRDPRLSPEKPQRRVFLFTDRAIYRPGQTLYFKGIATQVTAGPPQLLKNQSVSVRLLDANYQTVQTLTFTTSADYGSFNGSVVLPTGQLNGNYQLQTDDGSVSFLVEDYKRPTFQVQLDPVPGRPQLGQPLAVGGRARAYSGQPVDGARVAYRVRRRTFWPFYGRSDYGSGGRDNREIAHGTATTDAEGRFTFTFTPPTGPGAGGRQWQPGYQFELTADVTDAAGETHRAVESLFIGRNPLTITLSGPNYLDRRQLPALTLLGQNATGEPLPATGTLRLLARRFRPNPPGVPGPSPERERDELPGQEVKTLPFDTHASPVLDAATLLAGVPPGRYRLEAQAASPDTAAHAHLDFVLYDATAATVPYATPDWVLMPADTVAPGQPARLLLGSSEAGSRVLLEVERAGQLLRREWLTLPAGTQQRLDLDSGPGAAAGPLYVHTTQVRDGVLYRHNFTVQVAEPPRPLRLNLSTFRDRLQPGQRETWRLTVRQADGHPATAELLATLYDQSLDVFRPHQLEALTFPERSFPARFVWSYGPVSWRESRRYGKYGYSYFETDWKYDENMEPEYPEFRLWDKLNIGSRSSRRLSLFPPRIINPKFRNGGGRSMRLAAPAAAPGGAPGDAMMSLAANDRLAEAVVVGYGTAQPPPAPDLSAIAARSDFRETAFWMPALRTDANGDVVLEFQMPEAVTRWQLLALAHDPALHTGQLARRLVTQKEIQLTPNAPRFLRPGDSFSFPAKLSNLTDHAVSGTAQLFLLDAATGQDLTAQLLTGPAQQSVSAAAHQSQAVSWVLTIPADFAPVAVTYRVVAQASGGATSATPEKGKRRKSKRTSGELETRNEKQETTFTDGEENTLPVLPNRVLVTESLPLPIVGPGTREFELTKLTSTSNPTRRNQSLTLELTSNPAWYAVQSLPYLMEYPYECSEQTFSRLYANLLAARIIHANPRIRPVLAEWQRQAASGTPAQQAALAGKLLQNQELKSVLLQETPWVRDAQSETERLSRLATLFDSTRTAAETTRALTKLRAMQLPNGSWPWFERMPSDRYITQLLVTGFGKLKALGAFDASHDDTARPLLQSALAYLDQELTRDYDELRKVKGVKLTDDHLGDLQTQALYARSYWPAPAVAASARPAVAYYQGQAARHWLGRTRYLQAELALALYRADAKSAAARDILRALRENALHSPELGMYWKEVQPGYYWREAPTETQATLIEAFADVAQDQKAVDEMKLWLLKQKQTQSWESTRATADACYALLLRGSNWLAPSQPLQVTVGGQPVAAGTAQAGTGYLKTTWPAADVKPAQGKVTVTKPDVGVAWGALYWQYFEDLDKVTASASPLSLERQLYREVPSAAGPTLAPLTPAAPLRVGEVLVVRLVVRTDRALEYVHLKDQRAAGLEPLNQLSGYRYQGGLSYYESPRDAATHFFLGDVPRGTHVFEYRLRAAQAGNFSGGLSQVQCLYAPEFGATSAGQRLAIK